MKRYLLILAAFLLLASPLYASAAIAFDAGDTVTTCSSVSSCSFSHTIGSTKPNEILFVFALTTNNDASATYNGVAMTKIASQVETNDGRTISLFVLAGPTAGAHNIVISGTGTETLIRGMGASYSGALQSNTVDASIASHNDASVSSFTTTLTTLAIGDWAVLGVRQTGGVNTGGIAAGTNMNFRTNDTFDAIGDNNSAITPAGSYSITVNATTGTGGFYTIMAAFAPATFAPWQMSDF